MLRLHHAPDTAATVLRLTALEAGVPLELHPINTTAGTLVSPAYLALNPTGTIPVLETPQGPVSETGAALLWLAEAHGIGPAPGSADRPAFLKWLFFLSNTLHADLIRLIRPWRFAGPADEAGMATLTAARVLTSLAQVEAQMQRAPGLFPPLGPLSAYLVMLIRWAAQYPTGRPPWFHLNAFPGLADHAARAETRPAAASISKDEALGPWPFTAPPAAPRPSP